MKRRLLLAAAIAVIAAAAIAEAAYLARGRRYLLYTNEHAEHCWDALRRLTAESSSVRPVSVESASSSDGSTEITIHYTLDRVLAGAVLDISCAYRAESKGAVSVAMNGASIDPAALERVNAAGSR